MMARSRRSRRRKSRRRLAGFLAAAGILILFSAVCQFDRLVRKELPLVLVDGVDQSYTGRYVGQTGFQDLLAETMKTRQRALATVQDRLGIFLHETDSLMVRFKDGEPDIQVSARTNTYEVHGRRAQVVSVRIEPILLGMADLERTLIHELTHAVFRDRLGWRYAHLPYWLREAFAVWTAKQLRDKAEVTLAGQIFAGEPLDALINGLETQPHTYNDYLEDGLFLAYLEQAYGASAVQQAAHLVARGKSPKTVFERLSGREWKEVKVSARTFAEADIAARLAEAGYGAYQEAAGTAGSAGCEASVRQFRRFMRTYPRSFLLPNALYLRGSCFAQLNRNGRAMDSYEVIVKDFPHYGYLLDNALYGLGEAAVRTKAYERAIAVLEKLVNYSVVAEPRLIADAHYQRGVALSYLGRLREARGALRKARVGGTRFAGECEALLMRLNQGLGPRQG